MDDPTLEKENPTVNKTITVSETLSKSVDICTSNYILKGSYTDEDGFVEIDADFSDTDLVEEFKDRYYTIAELLNEVPIFLNKILSKLSEKEQEKAEVLIYCCKDWNEDEFEAVTE